MEAGAQWLAPPHAVTSLEIRAGAQWLAPSSPVTSHDNHNDNYNDNHNDNDNDNHNDNDSDSTPCDHGHNAATTQGALSRRSDRHIVPRNMLDHIVNRHSGEA